MKLNKTETEILETMEKYGRSTFTSEHGFRAYTKTGRHYGKREYKACLSLVEKGLFIQISQVSKSNDGWCYWITKFKRI